jgi:hypothetical protein
MGEAFLLDAWRGFIAMGMVSVFHGLQLIS